MKQVYIRRAPSTKESATAAVLAMGLGTLVAGTAFYVTRMLLARDRVRVLQASELDDEVESRS